jgi:XTP/dITP diphosphohydrolase
MKLVLGTKNPGKLRELHELAVQAPELKLVLAPPGFDPVEDGETFAENALIKAKAAAALSKCLSLGEDSGICVNALDGRPGIHSARYCEGTDEDRRRKLLHDLNETAATDRRAAYHCAMALVSPEGKTLNQSYAIWPGEIAFEELGSNGFGYDPIFMLPAIGKTSAQISREEKNAISHRAQAFKKMLDFLTTIRVAAKD